MQGAMGFAQKRLLSGKKQLIINCIKLFEKCSHSWQCFSGQQLSSFTLIKPIDILPQVHSARPGCCWRGRHESQAAAAGTLSLRGEVFQAAAATQSTALPSLKSPLQACIFILLLIRDMTLVASAAQEGQLVVCECQGKQSFGYLHAECSETHLIAAIYSSDPPDSQKFPFHPKE